MLINPILHNKTTIHSKYLDEDVFNLSDRTFNIPDTFTFQVVEITEDLIARMDLVSLQVYNTNQYSDLLCKLNGISNPFELNEGMRIIVPAFEELNNFYYVESPAESDSQVDAEGNEMPKAKAKTEKRKPNEAIVGDKRYKIDSSHKVIIY